MAYTPYYNSSGAPNWQNDPSTSTPIRAEALNNIEQGLCNIGTVVTGTNASSLSVANSTAAVISSVTVPAGTYVVNGVFEWSTGFGEHTMGDIQTSAGILAIQRGTGWDKGGTVLTAILTVTASTLINMLAYQDSGSAKTVRNVSLKAVRIC